jgi:hypothetical protein
MRGIVLMPLPSDYTSGSAAGHARIHAGGSPLRIGFQSVFGLAADANSIDCFPIK